MGVNLFVLVQTYPEADDDVNSTSYAAIVDSINAEYGGDDDKDGKYFTWCDIYKGTDAKPLMTFEEAKAITDDMIPWFVFDEHGYHVIEGNKNAYLTLAERWRHDANTRVLFLKARL